MLIIRYFIMLLIFLSGASLACGELVAQGPFTVKFNPNIEICFEYTPGGIEVVFFADDKTQKNEPRKKIDTFLFSDAPPQMVSVFFDTIKDKNYIFVIIRRNVLYPLKNGMAEYEYQIIPYKVIGDNIIKDEKLGADKNFIGYQIYLNRRQELFALDNAEKAKKYIKNKYK